MGYKGWRNFRHTYISLSQVFLLWPVQKMHEVLKTSRLSAQFVLSAKLEHLRTLFSCGKNGSVLLFPLVPKLVWESLCCLCQRRHIVKSGNFFFSLHFPSYLITAEQLGSHRGLQNRNSQEGKVLSNVVVWWNTFLEGQDFLMRHMVKVYVLLLCTPGKD